MTLTTPCAPSPTTTDQGRATPINFTVGARVLLSISRQLAQMPYGLSDLIEGRVRTPPPMTSGVDGFRILSAPAGELDRFRKAMPHMIIGPADHFERRYICMDGSFEDYLQKFSAKTRATFRRKVRKVAAMTDGRVDVRAYRTVREIDEFLKLAWPLSAATYQERNLGAGLPRGAAAHETMRAMAAKDAVRAFLLFVGDDPVAYLYLPVVGTDDARTLVYAHLGYRPDHAQHSAGTVLQLESLRLLFDEQCFRLFDFTEGDGAHKMLFSTHSLPAVSFIALRATTANRILLAALTWFNTVVARGSALADRMGWKARVGALLKG